MTRRRYAIRYAVVLLAGLAGLVSAPEALRATLTLLALLITADALGVLSPATDIAERVVFSALGAIATLVILGLVLNELPGHLNQTNWVLGLSLIGLVVVTVAQRRDESREVIARGGPAPRTAIAAGTIVLVATAVGLVIGEAGVRAANGRPLLALSAPRWTNTSAEVLLTSTDIVGQFRLTVQSGTDRPATSIPVSLDADRKARRIFHLALPPTSDYWLITLAPENAGAADLNRSVILARTLPPAKAHRSTVAPRSGLIQ